MNVRKIEEKAFLNILCSICVPLRNAMFPVLAVYKYSGSTSNVYNEDKTLMSVQFVDEFAAKNIPLKHVLSKLGA